MVWDVERVLARPGGDRPLCEHPAFRQHRAPRTRRSSCACAALSCKGTSYPRENYLNRYPHLNSTNRRGVTSIARCHGFSRRRGSYQPPLRYYEDFLRDLGIGGSVAKWSTEEVTVRTVETHQAETWTEVSVSPRDCIEDSVTSDEQPTALGDPISEYFTASSDVSLLSDPDLPDKGQDDPVGENGERVIAGHVAAMRERFESMTRANTPCPDLMRSSSPTLDVFRITPSPDNLA